MKIEILTLFPEMFAPLECSILKRARAKNLFELSVIDIRPYAENKHKKCDDYPFGGGAGMVMMAQPIASAIKDIDPNREALRYYMSPQGKTFCQADAEEMSKLERVILLCGHYEGVDQRVLDKYFDGEISIGDFVLTGGELPAMTVADAICRMVPGVLPDEECFMEESHWDGLLEHPQYSRPEQWQERRVPDVLLSGHHGNVAAWRKKESYKRTMVRRPDLFAKFDESKLTTKAERKILQQAKDEVAGQ